MFVKNFREIPRHEKEDSKKKILIGFRPTPSYPSQRIAALDRVNETSTDLLGGVGVVFSN